MITKITEGIKITVQPTFNSKLSIIEENSFVFEYQIIIQNSKPERVQLISREWHIFDSLNERTIVSGMGVVGEQPILDFQQAHSYKSYCEIKSEVGFMEGVYTFMNLSTGAKFRASIPRFNLVFPPKMN
jgi:ApaG protein